MSKYTSTHGGYQNAMEWSLTGPSEGAKDYAEGIVLPSFYHVMNGDKIEYDTWVKGVAEWRSKTSDYKPKVEEFLRDGDQLAARMTGSIKIEGVDSFFESFMFAKIDKETGKMEYLIERAIWGQAGKEPEHGVN